MDMKKFTIIFLIFFSSVYAQQDLYLTLNTNKARPVAMGSAYTSIEDNIVSATYNPASLNLYQKEKKFRITFFFNPVTPAVLLHDDLKKENFDDVIAISLLTEQDVSPILTMINRFMPFNPPYYAPEELSDLPMRFFAQEIIREQIFLNFRDEIPYSSTVTVEKYIEFPNKVEIAANIWLERKSQKPILIGNKGQNIKNLRLKSEKEIYKILGKRARLDLWVKIKPGWRKKKNALKEFGYR